MKLKAPAWCEHCKKARAKTGVYFTFCTYHKKSLEKSHLKIKERLLPAMEKAFRNISI